MKQLRIMIYGGGKIIFGVANQNFLNAKDAGNHWLWNGLKIRMNTG